MKRVLAVMIAVGVMASASVALAATIKNTKHDLSTGNTGLTGGSDQVCIYCHTPHNATEAIPLWNRTAATATGFTFYSSPSMKLHRSAGNGGQFESSSISLFCMSCHDGSAIGGKIANPGASALVGTSTPSATVPAVDADAIVGTALFGSDMSKSHPVNIQLNTASLNGIYAPTAGAKSINGASGLTTDLPLFKGTDGNGYIECGSCHAVHDNTASPFLRTSNANSKLCLACHMK